MAIQINAMCQGISASQIILSEFFNILSDKKDSKARAIKITNFAVELTFSFNLPLLKKDLLSISVSLNAKLAMLSQRISLVGDNQWVGGMFSPFAPKKLFKN